MPSSCRPCSTPCCRTRRLGTVIYSSLKCILVAAAPISDATAYLARDVFGQDDALYQGYGQTEVLPVSMMGPRQWFAEMEGSNPIRSCGMPLPFAEIEIWDEENNPVPLGDPGEIVARTDGQMVGFWNNPEATAERIVRGWVKTGDVGRLDRNGYLYILDRSDDMIISGGFNIWPLELETSSPTCRAWWRLPCSACRTNAGARHAGDLRAGRHGRGIRGRRDPHLRRAAGVLQEAFEGRVPEGSAAQVTGRQDPPQGSARTLLERHRPPRRWQLTGGDGGAGGRAIPDRILVRLRQPYAYVAAESPDCRKRTGRGSSGARFGAVFPHTTTRTRATVSR